MRVTTQLIEFIVILGVLAAARPALGQDWSVTPPPDGEVQASFDDALSPYGDWTDVDGTRVWHPAASAVGEDFQPYATNGQWVSSDYGWYFQSDYPWGWAPFHYGRWALDPNYGWIWIPGTVWAPAWVDWRSGGGYIGWAPLPAHRLVGGGATLAPLLVLRPRRALRRQLLGPPASRGKHPLRLCRDSSRPPGGGLWRCTLVRGAAGRSSGARERPTHSAPHRRVYAAGARPHSARPTPGARTGEFRSASGVRPPNGAPALPASDECTPAAQPSSAAGNQPPPAARLLRAARGTQLCRALDWRQRRAEPFGERSKLEWGRNANPAPLLLRADGLSHESRLRGEQWTRRGRRTRRPSLVPPLRWYTPRPTHALCAGAAVDSLRSPRLLPAWAKGRAASGDRGRSCWWGTIPIR